MSRCFAFPPPGYEKKATAENIDSLTKEKLKEKKHKKDKRDREKREHREKKDKDRSSDKHKEKKDRKDKHKGKEKDQDREKAGTSEVRRVEGQIEGLNEFHTRESFEKAEECNDFKFTEELGRWTRDDGAVNRFLGSFRNSFRRKFEGIDVASGSLEKERFPNNKVFSGQICPTQRRNDGSSRPSENNISFLQRKTGTISTTTTLEKERGKIHEKITFSSVSEQNRNHVVSCPLESISGLAHRKPEGSNIAPGLEKEKYSEKVMVSGFIATRLDKGKVGEKIATSNSISETERTNDVSGQTVENFYSNHNSRIDDMGDKPSLDKEGAKGYKMFPFSISSEQRRNSTAGQPMEKHMYQQIGRTNKIEDKKVEEKQQTRSKDHSEKESKKNKKDRQNKEKKKEEKIIGKADDTEHCMISRNFGMKDRIDTVNLKTFASHKDYIFAIGIDGTTNKRKFPETNGFSHENDAQPYKTLKISTSSQHLMNGGISHLNRAISSSILLKNGALNNLKHYSTILENKEKNKLNGIAKSQQLPVEPKPLNQGLIENEEVSLSLPRPDSKYLSQIYTVPKMDEWIEFDDQEWLFNGCDSRQKPQAEPLAEKAPVVWTDAVQIELADVFALPYVVPF